MWSENLKREASVHKSHGRTQVNIWLCPVKPRSWQIVKKLKIFGMPRHASKVIEKVKSDDLLVFHVLKPVNGIVAICRVVSEVYEDNKDIWGKDRYPLRVRIDFVPGKQRDESNPIPLCSLFGSHSKSEISIEPYLRNVWITDVTNKQYQLLERIFEKSNSNGRNRRRRTQKI
jgi:hypothetical protein